MTNVFLAGFDGTITASTYAVISSEFNAANTASWLTTSYLITSTAFQPLYGRFSDIFGRRSSFFTATIAFMLGCIGCAVARNIIFLNAMRALTGIGGGGLMTMATIVNSDLIPFRRRGMYQATQNVLNGFGAICGASFGGSIVDSIGWRWCFLLQVPVSLFALVTGHLVLMLPRQDEYVQSGLRDIWKYVDLSGACILILGLSSQLVGLSLGGNELPWSNVWVILSLVASVVLLAAFLLIEAKTTAIPLIPPRMLQGVLPIATQISNVCVGMAAYAVRLSPWCVCSLFLTGIVPLHSSAAVPGDPTGFPDQSWSSTSYPVTSNACWWPHLRYRHVSLGQTCLSRSYWRSVDVHWQFPRDVLAIRRFRMEVLHLCNPG